MTSSIGLSNHHSRASSLPLRLPVRRHLIFNPHIWLLASTAARLRLRRLSILRKWRHDRLSFLSHDQGAPSTGPPRRRAPDFLPLLAGYAAGNFQGFDANGASRDWRDWQGGGHGYEGLLVDKIISPCRRCSTRPARQISQGRQELRRRKNRDPSAKFRPREN